MLVLVLKIPIWCALRACRSTWLNAFAASNSAQIAQRKPMPGGAPGVCSRSCVPGAGRHRAQANSTVRAEGDVRLLRRLDRMHACYRTRGNELAGPERAPA
jgi:hypothetical protein